MSVRTASVRLAGYVTPWVTGILVVLLFVPVGLAGVRTDAATSRVPVHDILNLHPSLTPLQSRQKLASLPLSAESTPEKGIGLNPCGGTLEGVIIVGLSDNAAEVSAWVDAKSTTAVASELGVSAWAPWYAGAGADEIGDIRYIFCDTGESPGAAAKRWASLPGVDFAEPCYLPGIARVPDDPRAGEQPHLNLMGVYDAWDMVDEADRSLMVAIVDGGVWIEHPDLEPNLHLNELDPPNGIDDDGNGFVDDYRGWNFGAGNDDPGALAGVTPQSVAHGTHVAGLAGAAVNNGIGGAGIAWNPPILCVAAGHAQLDDSILYAYQGLLYAASRGARVINCSWESGVSSLLQKRVVDYVLGLGVVIVAAAGNQGDTEERYPAAFDGVLAVANLTNELQCAPTSSRGYWVDLAAPGTELLSTYTDPQYAPLSGTSMASPLVAGCAALLWGVNPGLSAEAVRQRMRASARSLYGTTPEAPLMGAGLVSARDALAWDGPGIRIVALELLDGDRDGIVEHGENIVLRPRWRNYLEASDSPVTVDLSCDSPWVTILEGDAVLPALASGSEGYADLDFALVVGPGAAPGSRLALVWNFGESRQTTELMVESSNRDLLGGEIEMTVGGNGRLGFTASAGGTGRDGVGFNYRPVGGQAVENLLFEGALMVASGEERMSDAARSFRFGEFQEDFKALSSAQSLKVPSEIELSTGERLGCVAVSFSDSTAPAPLPVRLDWLALAPDAGETPGCALLATTIRNLGDELQQNLHLGFFLDWDLFGDGLLPPNVPNSLIYVRDGGYSLAFRSENPEAVNVAAAMVTKTDVPVRCRCINNNDFDPDNPSWGLYLNFSDAHKWEALSDDQGPQEALDTDISAVPAVGPFNLAPGDSMRVVLVLAAGLGSAETIANVEGGMELAERVLAESSWHAPVPTRKVSSAWPNPWNGTVKVSVSGNPVAAWKLLVYDLRGRLVYRSPAVILPSGEGTLAWDGGTLQGRPAPSGGYLMIIGQGDQTWSRKVTLVR